MTKDEFASKIKQKYPVYANLDNNVLVGKVLQKYPQYGSQLDQEPSTMGMAKQAIGETLSEDLPVIGKAVGALRNDIPQAMAEKYGMPGAVAGTAIGTAAELLPKTGSDLAIQSFTGPALKGMGLAIKKGAIPLAREVLPKITEALTSIESPIVERAIQRAGKISQKMSGKLDADITDMAVKKLQTAVDTAKQTIGRKLGTIEDVVASKSTSKIPIGDLNDDLAKRLANAGYKVKGYVESEVSSKLPKDVGEILNDFNKKEPISFKGALSLRRKIDRTVDFIRSGSMKVGKDVDAILLNIRKGLNERLLASEPDFKRANDAYANVSQNYRLLQESLSGKEEIVSKRIASLFRKGSVERKIVDRLDAMGGQASSAMDDLLDTITAQKFASNIHPSIKKAFTNTGGGMVANVAKVLGLEGLAAHEGVPFAGPAIVGATTAATSPKLNFRLLQAAKAISNELKKIGLGPASEIALSLTAPRLHDAVLNHAMDEHLNDTSTP